MMIRRNANILVLGAALVLALPAVVSAQMSRVEGMAIQGDFIKDWSNVFTYTSQVGSVGNLVYGELGNVSTVTNSDQSVGAVIGNLWEGRLGTWSIHMRSLTPGLGQGNSSTPVGPGSNGSDKNINASESFDLMWGKKFGTNSVGLRLNRSYGSVEGWVDQFFGGAASKIANGDPTSGLSLSQQNLHRNVLGIGGGFGFELSPTANVEGSILFQQRTFLHTDTTGTGPVVIRTREEDGPTTYQVAARAMWQWQPNIMVVPVVKIYSFDLSTRETTTPAPATPVAPVKSTLKGVQVGLAGNWTLGSNDLFVLGATFAQNKFEQANATVIWEETYAPQVFAALETHVNSWLTLRFGANKGVMHSIERTEPAFPGVAKVKIKESDFSMSLGAGVKVGNLQLDGILANDFHNNLPFFISGEPTNDMFSKVTATYPW